MFAEDVSLLPDNMFTRMLEHARKEPGQFSELSRDLFRAMANGERIGFEAVAWFNGGLFDNDETLPMERDEIDITLKAAGLDWSEIDPSILGTLFERGLDPDKRAQLGAHYTDRDKIMMIVEPVVVRPLLAEWNKTKTEIAATMDGAGSAKAKATRTRRRQQAERTLRTFLERLRKFVVLDPACGSGNFLYLALHALKDIEHRVQLEAEEMGLQRGFPAVGPANVKGIEINAYAAELARVSVWIGDIQWMRRNGFTATDKPILKPLETIECRDAILTPDGTEPEWPRANVVIGNPPFLGDKLMRDALGHEYTERLRKTYRRSLSASSDLVCYWFAKAIDLVSRGDMARAGLVSTNSIRGGNNRMTVERVVEQGTIFDAWSDEPWVIDGAAVRVSLICFCPKNTDLPVSLNGTRANQIHADLTEGATDLTAVSRLQINAGVAFLGIYKNGPFDIPGEVAREWLKLPSNPNGRPNADVLMPRTNGRDLTQRSSGQWIIDFGASMSEAEAALYEEPFAHVAQYVKPLRLKQRREKRRRYWWRHAYPSPHLTIK